MPNTKTTIQTTTEKNSIKIVEHKVITFKELWDNYPSETVKHIHPETGKDIFPDHCAVHLSESFFQSGIKLKSFKGTRCWQCPHGKGVHIFRAQEFANWLRKRPFAGCPKAVELTGSTFEKYVTGKKGLIFFKDYWQRKEEQGTKRRSGDHVDLWDENELKSNGYWATLVRMSFSSLSESFLDMSDLQKSTQVLFWEIK